MSRQLEAQFMNAATALQAGDARTAKQGFLKVTRKLPDSAAAWYNLGLSYQHLDDHQRAIAAYKRTLGLEPGHIDAWVNLGLSQKHCGDPDAARVGAEKALTLNIRHPRALNLLGTLEAEAGNPEAARKYFEHCLESEPGNTDAAVNLVNLHLDAGDLEAADRVSAELLARMPGDKRVKLLRIKVSIRRRVFDQAASLIQELREGHDDAEVLRVDLTLREALRDHFGVIDVAGELATLTPDDGGVWNSLGSAYFQLDSVDRAKGHYEKAIALDPQNSQFHSNLGLVYSSLGDRGSAEKYYRRALQLDPRNGEAYRQVATMKRFRSLSDLDIQAVEALWAETEGDRLNRIQLAFALGKMYDDCGAHDQAFSVYRAGNDLKFAQSDFDIERYLAHMDRIAGTLTERPSVTEKLEGPQPIFILGMPRSGTTLVEQIISRHPQVLACGELPCIERAIMYLEKGANPMRVYPDDFASLERSDFVRQARSYIEWVGRLHELRQPFLTDKMPFNFVHIWLIKALFPEAAIIHCRRHPLDVIVSNYFQFYGSEVSFVYNLKALAEYFVRYVRLTRHWKQLFGDEIADIGYESLVNDTEVGTRCLIDAAKLPWSDACLDPNSSGRTVRTASIWQVRQGIYTDSRERWRKYERHLGDAVDILIREKILDSESLQPVPDNS